MKELLQPDREKLEIVDNALSLEGFFTFCQIHGIENIGGNIDTPDPNGLIDNSGLVWLILARTNNIVPDNMSWHTGSMRDDAESENKWIKKIERETAKAGDIVIGHSKSRGRYVGNAAILLENFKGPVTKIIQIGGSYDYVHQTTIEIGFESFKDEEIIYASAKKINKFIIT